MHSAAPSATHCVLFRAGPTFAVSRSSAYAYGGGVEMSGPIDIVPVTGNTLYGVLSGYPPARGLPADVQWAAGSAPTARSSPPAQDAVQLRARAQADRDERHRPVG